MPRLFDPNLKHDHQPRTSTRSAFPEKAMRMAVNGRDETRFRSGTGTSSCSSADARAPAVRSPATARRPAVGPAAPEVGSSIYASPQLLTGVFQRGHQEHIVTRWVNLYEQMSARDTAERRAVATFRARRLFSASIDGAQ